MVEPPSNIWEPDGNPHFEALNRWPSGLTIGIAATLTSTLAAIAASIIEHDIATGLFVAAVVVAAVVVAAVVVAAVVVAAVFVRNRSRRATFTFGEGFLGYRSDMGWPRGVQEDD